MDLVLGLDLGTSYFKCGLFDRDGRLHGLGRAAVETVSDGTRCELPLDTFWSTLRQALAMALRHAEAQPSDLRAVSYSSQANSFVLMDRTGEPLTPLILWPDRRAEDLPTDVLRLWRREDFSRITGLGQTSFEMALAKIVQIRDRDPALWRRTARVLTISDYLVRELTGQTCGDEGTASLLGLWNLPAHGWWREALDLVRIAPETLATPLPPGTVAGPLCGPGADQLHLPAGRPLAVGTLDHHAAAIGSGAVTHDACCVSLGTVLVCLRGLDRFQPRPDCFMGPGLSAETFTQLACDGNGASVLEWYRRTHAPDLTPEQLELRAATVPPGCDGLTARPCAHRAGGLSGFVNRSPQHEPAHYARAIMESVAESLAGLMTRLFGHALPPRAIAAGGGTRSALWMEILSARLGMTLTPAPHPEAACRGAAMFAAAAAGWQDSVPATASQWSRAAPVRSAMP